jgi:hypothetical protein
MNNKNFMEVCGKDVNTSNAPLKVNLADDFKEVRGFGRLITASLAKQMARSYFHDVKSGQQVLEMIEQDKSGKYHEIQSSDEYKALRSFLNPDSHIVSGVFGKEIILQLLSQKDCEGIRYIMGMDDGKMTIVLIGVKEVPDSTITSASGHTIAKSEPIVPIGKEDFYKKDRLYSSDDPEHGEVHEHSLKIAEVEMQIVNFEGVPNPNNVIFGKF